MGWGGRGGGSRPYHPPIDSQDPLSHPTVYIITWYLVTTTSEHKCMCIAFCVNFSCSHRQKPYPPPPQIRVSLSLRGLSDQTTAVIHAGGPATTAGATLITLPLGSFMGLVYQDSATSSVINQLLAGGAYINICSTSFPNGGSSCLPLVSPPVLGVTLPSLLTLTRRLTMTLSMCRDSPWPPALCCVLCRVAMCHSSQASSVAKCCSVPRE